MPRERGFVSLSFSLSLSLWSGGRHCHNLHVSSPSLRPPPPFFPLSTFSCCFSSLRSFSLVPTERYIPTSPLPCGENSLGLLQAVSGGPSGPPTPHEYRYCVPFTRSCPGLSLPASPPTVGIRRELAVSAAGGRASGASRMPDPTAMSMSVARSSRHPVYTNRGDIRSR
ncbi:hypothetical protein LZ30DRAFT_333843 [Colletotrichum cereale]|nr:hypothetical protein LZ30DRAFT_333843 [Colletotrichum cereale]